MQDMEQVYKNYFTRIYKYLFCLTHDQDISEELTQETFYRAVKKIDSFKGNCHICVWLCQIAKNLWLDEQKKKKRFHLVEELEDSLLDNKKGPEDTFLEKEEKFSLYKKMQQLDQQTREVIYLRITGELSFREIAEILNKTENWARVTFYRGKQKLKGEG